MFDQPQMFGALGCTEPVDSVLGRWSLSFFGLQGHYPAFAPPVLATVVVDDPRRRLTTCRVSCCCIHVGSRWQSTWNEARNVHGSMNSVVQSTNPLAERACFWPLMYQGPHKP